MILDTTIGREVETETVLRNVAQGIHTLLIGRNGVGKTHLLLEIQRAFRGSERQVCYLRRPVPAKETGDTLYSWLSMTAGVTKPRRVHERTRIADLSDLIAEVLSLPGMVEKKLLLLVDEFDQLPVLAVPFFEVLAERVTMIAAVRSRYKNPRFNRLFWRFEELDVNPLSPKDARVLAERAVSRVAGVRTVDDETREFLINQVAINSNGVPAAIIESVERLRGAERIDTSFVRELFMHRSGARYFDATPLILAFAAFLVVMRYINRGMYQFDMYAIFGALSGLMLLVRWFMTRTSRENG